MDATRISEENDEINVDICDSDKSITDNLVSKNQPKKKKSNTSFQDSLIDALLNPPFLTNPPVPEDPDKAFLLSFLPDIKELNDDEKMELKFQFLQNLRSILHNKKSVQPQNIYSNYTSAINIPLGQTSQPQVYPYSSVPGPYNSNFYSSQPSLDHLTPQVYSTYSSISDPSSSNSDPA